jgi:hypothetical protein
MKRVLSILAVCVVAGCTDASTATRALEGAGYKDIQMTGYDWFACSKDDFYHSGFVAKGPTGRQVTGVVCSGLIFKAATIRME